MLHHNHRDEYPKVIFRGYRKGSFQRWFHIDLGDMPRWPNKHLLPPLIKDEWKALEESPRMKALVKRVAELRRASLSLHRRFHSSMSPIARPQGEAGL
jgi:hypothetical protein